MTIGERGREIEAESFRIVEDAADLGSFSPDARRVATRIIHALGDLNIAPDLVITDEGLRSALLALDSGSPIVLDTRMIAAGISRKRLAGLDTRIIVPSLLLSSRGTGGGRRTRSAEAFSLIREDLKGALVVIGNAPTALREVIRLAGEGIRPAAVVGMPVGFVDAAESKVALIESGIPHITLNGTRGGSAAALAALHAIMDLALEKRKDRRGDGEPGGDGEPREDRRGLTIIGMHGGLDSLTPRAIAPLLSAERIIGPRRLIEALPAAAGGRRYIYSSIDEAVHLAGEDGAKTVLLASGDPGFHGIVRTLKERVPDLSPAIIPSTTSLQEAFARFGLPWDDAEFVSLHDSGDPLSLLEALSRRRRVGVLTGRVSANEIGNILIDAGLTKARIQLAENLGTEAERTRALEAGELATETGISPLSVLIIEHDGPRGPRSFIPDREFERGGPMTKREVRSIGAAALSLSPGTLLWDIGAGTGSISIEAASVYSAHVHAVERSPEAAKAMRENLARFGPLPILLHEGEAPGILQGLPDPGAVFVGGSGGRMETILSHAASRLGRGGRIVLHLSLMDRVAPARSSLSALGLDTEVIEVGINRGKDLAGGISRSPLRPVFVMVGTKR